MYKYYNKNDYKVMMYDFDSITEFLGYLESQPINTKVFYEDDLSSNSYDFGFYHTDNFEEAVRLCKYGCHEDFERLVQLKHTLEKYVKWSKEKHKQFSYYAGYAPNVKAYLEGSPLSMFDRKLPQRKHIDIYYNSAILGDVSYPEIFNRGAITLNLVEILESKGFSVNLNVFTMSSEHSQVHYAKFNLKHDGERLNIQKLYFPMCHPSFLRRLVFRLREQTPDIDFDWKYSYGRTCNNQQIREILDLKENDIVICQPYEMGVRGYDILEDANAMFDYINSYTGDDIELEQVKRRL